MFSRKFYKSELAAAPETVVDNVQFFREMITYQLCKHPQMVQRVLFVFRVQQLDRQQHLEQ